MTKDGFIQLPNHVYDEVTDPYLLHAILYILRTRDYETNKITVGARNIAAEYGWGIGKSYRALKWAKLAVQSMKSDVCDNRNKSGTKAEHPNPPPGRASEPRPEQKRNKSGTFPADDLIYNTKSKKNKLHTYSPLFERVWAVYPQNNGAKYAAYKKFQKQNPNDIEVDDWIEAIEMQKNYQAYCKENNLFYPEFPFLQKWIGERRWENKPITPARPPDKVKLQERESKGTRALKVLAEFGGVGNGTGDPGLVQESSRHGDGAAVRGPLKLPPGGRE